MIDNKALLLGLLCAPLLVACPRLPGFDDPDVAQSEDGEFCEDNTECLSGQCVDNVCGPASPGETGPGDDGGTDSEDGSTDESSTGEPPGDGDGDGDGDGGLCLDLGAVCDGGGCCTDLFCPEFFGYAEPVCEPKRQAGEYCMDEGECVSAVCVDNLCAAIACVDQGEVCEGDGTPCCEGYCSAFDYGEPVCLPFAQPGEFCVDATQCASGECTDFVCG